ncbi:MAG TPA: GAF domain-containing protein [Thermoanaerobaculia bacterium]|nr:GAF domain-containing protein [Thermoanaerobaculia bacterium]
MTNNNEPIRPYIAKIVNDAREYVQSLLDENNRLHGLLADIQEESRRTSARYVEVEQQNTNLANLYVASYQLHGTLDRQRVLDAIKEIIINLIGSEQLAIWEVDRENEQLKLADSFGIDTKAWSSIPLDLHSGIIGLVTVTGERFVNGQSAMQPMGPEEGLTACIPLKLDDRVIGAIGIWSLLAQKEKLEPVDFELFDLIASHGATALFCTQLASATVTV